MSDVEPAEKIPLLRAQHVTKRLRDGDQVATILANIDLEVHTRERVALVGPSGSGKSSLLHILGALDPDYEGTVEIAARRLGDLRDAERARFRNETLGFVFQSYNLLGHLSALDNVLLPARFSRHGADPRRALEMLASVGLGTKSHRKPHALSGGERQRVAIARALYNQPKLVLCDEPTGNLDPGTGREVLELFERLRDDGAALLIATHDDAIAAAADRVLSLHEGQLQ